MPPCAHRANSAAAKAATDAQRETVLKLRQRALGAIAEETSPDPNTRLSLTSAISATVPASNNGGRKSSEARQLWASERRRTGARLSLCPVAFHRNREPIAGPQCLCSRQQPDCGLDGRIAAWC
jgi:hypothetical protein